MPAYYLTGVSGVGKSAVVKQLNQRGILSYDIDSVPGLCHWRNKTTGKRADYYSGIGRDWLEAHEWICDIRLLEKLIPAGEKNVVIAGLASNQDEFLSLFSKIFLLHCKEEIFLRRLSARSEDNDFAKDKDEQKHILSWYREFEKKMLDGGAVSINTEDSISAVVEKIITGIKT